jgi:hypothetical protein
LLFSHGCIFEEGLKLSDIFILFKNHVEVFDALLSNWLEEYVEEAFLPKEQQEPERGKNRYVR